MEGGRSSSGKISVMVSGPFSMAVDFTGHFDSPTRRRLDFILETLQELGCQHFSAHRAEDWGQLKIHPGDIARRDLTELERCTHIIAYIGQVWSPGTWLEVGYGVSRRKNLLLIREPGQGARSAFVDGLCELHLAQTVEFENSETIKEAIRLFVLARPPK